MFQSGDETTTGACMQYEDLYLRSIGDTCNLGTSRAQSDRSDHGEMQGASGHSRSEATSSCKPLTIFSPFPAEVCVEVVVGSEGGVKISRSTQTGEENGHVQITAPLSQVQILI